MICCGFQGIMLRGLPRTVDLMDKMIFKILMEAKGIRRNEGGKLIQKKKIDGNKVHLKNI